MAAVQLLTTLAPWASVLLELAKTGASAPLLAMLGGVVAIVLSLAKAVTMVAGGGYLDFKKFNAEQKRLGAPASTQGDAEQPDRGHVPQMLTRRPRCRGRLASAQCSRHRLPPRSWRIR